VGSLEQEGNHRRATYRNQSPEGGKGDGTSTVFGLVGHDVGVGFAGLGIEFAVTIRIDSITFVADSKREGGILIALEVQVGDGDVRALSDGLELSEVSLCALSNGLPLTLNLGLWFKAAFSVYPTARSTATS